MSTPTTDSYKRIIKHEIITKLQPIITLNPRFFSCFLPHPILVSAEIQSSHEVAMMVKKTLRLEQMEQYVVNV